MPTEIAVNSDILSLAAPGAGALALAAAAWGAALRHRSHLPKEIALGLPMLLLAGGVTLLVLSVVLHREDREHDAQSLAGLSAQTRYRTEHQDDLNEPGLLAVLAGAFLLAGALSAGRRAWMKGGPRFDGPGALLMLGGWVGFGYAASCRNHSLKSVEEERLAWTLPGGALLVAGAVVSAGGLPPTDLAMAAVLGGGVLVAQGTSLVVDPPDGL